LNKVSDLQRQIERLKQDQKVVINILSDVRTSLGIENVAGPMLEHTISIFLTKYKEQSQNLKERMVENQSLLDDLGSVREQLKLSENAHREVENKWRSKENELRKEIASQDKNVKDMHSLHAEVLGKMAAAEKEFEKRMKKQAKRLKEIEAKSRIGEATARANDFAWNEERTKLEEKSSTLEILLRGSKPRTTS
jgi:hypothetical protein